MVAPVLGRAGLLRGLSGMASGTLLCVLWTRQASRIERTFFPEAVWAYVVHERRGVWWQRRTHPTGRRVWAVVSLVGGLGQAGVTGSGAMWGEGVGVVGGCVCLVV